MKLKTLFYILIVVCFTNCNLSSPVGFWKKFEYQNRVEFINHNGWFGGIHVLHWIGINGKYNKNEIIKLAKDNGWVLKKEQTFSSKQTHKWVYNDKAIFPVSWGKFNPEIETPFSSFENFPRWIEGKITVLSFETDLVSIDPSTQENHLINGFVILSEERNEMTLYHEWGE
jgi:hypothetical protein